MHNYYFVRTTFTLAGIGIDCKSCEARAFFASFFTAFRVRATVQETTWTKVCRGCHTSNIKYKIMKDVSCKQCTILECGDQGENGGIVEFW